MNTKSYMNSEQVNYYLLVRTILLAVVTSALGMYLLYKHDHTPSALGTISVLLTAFIVSFIATYVWLEHTWTYILGNSFILTPSREVFKVFYTDTWVSKSEMRILLPDKNYRFKCFTSQPATCFITVKISEKTTLCCKVIANAPEGLLSITALVNFLRKTNPETDVALLDTSDLTLILRTVFEKFEASHLPQLKKFEMEYDAGAQVRFRSMLQEFIKEIGDPVEFIQIDEGTEISFV